MFKTYFQVKEHEKSDYDDFADTKGTQILMLPTGHEYSATTLVKPITGIQIIIRKT